MSYQRFLTDNDYLALITTEGLEQLTRGDVTRLAQAEQRAEMKIVDFLDQFYEIGKALEIGKKIKDYSCFVTYPSNAYFKKDGKIYKTIKSLNAQHKPTLTEYWEQCDELALPAEQLVEEKKKVLPYLQLRTYRPGDVVSYLGGTWKCLVPNGWDFNDIQIPGIKYWERVETNEWVANYHYVVGDTVEYEGELYAVVYDDSTAEEGLVIDWSNDPQVNDAYGLIGDYDEGYNYSIEGYDYVVFEGNVFKPVLSPNVEEPEVNVNIVPDDPRNYNLVNYMTAIALYYLNALIAPTNVPETRVDMFNEALLWIENAAKMRLDPHIPRKIDRCEHKPIDDWAMASFETNAATQIHSPWFI